jgi:hypothetical protein
MDCNIKMGDLLYRQKNFVEHAGVYLGSEMVFHISPTNGAETISFSEYAEGLTVKIVHTNFDNKHILEQRISEILQSNSNYNFGSNNCEHIASYIIYGKKMSSQVQATLCGAIICMLFGRKLSFSTILTLAIIGGVSGCLLSNNLRQYDKRIEPMSLLLAESGSAV